MCVKNKKRKKKMYNNYPYAMVCKIGSYLVYIYIYISGYDYLVINNVCECMYYFIYKNFLLLNVLYIRIIILRDNFVVLKGVFVFILERRVLPVLFVFVCCCVCNNLCFFYIIKFFFIIWMV